MEKSKTAENEQSPRVVPLLMPYIPTGTFTTTNITSTSTITATITVTDTTTIPCRKYITATLLTLLQILSINGFGVESPKWEE